MPIRQFAVVTAQAMSTHASYLTHLDRLIGDADHGTNMKRGFDAIVAASDGWTCLPWPDVLHEAGQTLVLSIGGASGALYGSLLLGMARASGDGAEWPEQWAEGVDWVRHRGRAEAGAKTMLDVLVPVRDAIRQKRSLQDIRAVADTACASTRDMLATRGRAAYLRERSRGHIDPGAASSRLLVHAVCDVLEPCA